MQRDKSNVQGEQIICWTIHTVLHKTCEWKMITNKILLMKNMKASIKALLYYLLNFIGQLILSLQASTEVPRQECSAWWTLLSSLLCTLKRAWFSYLCSTQGTAEIFNWFLPELSLPWADETTFPQFVLIHHALTPRPPQWSSALPSPVCQGPSFLGEPTTEQNILQIAPWVPRRR